MTWNDALILALAPAWVIFLAWLRRRETPARPRWGLLTILLLATAGAIFVLFAFPLKNFVDAFPIDDSYITLTAARNLAEHNVLAVNLQYPLAGVTSPLHVAITGLVAKLMPVEIASRVVGLLFFLALGPGVLLWAKELGARPTTAAAAAAISLLGGPLAFGALNGLETTPFAAMLIWTFYVYEVAWRRNRFWLLVGAMIGLTILTRPEGWFVAAALYIAAGYRFRRDQSTREWRRFVFVALSIATAGVVLAPYLLANLHYDHQLFPSTVSAKKYFFADFCRPFGQRVFIALLSLILLGLYVFLTPLLFWSRTFLRRVYPWLFILIFYAAYTSQFVGALTHYWGRYQHPLLPVLLVGILLGAESLFAGLTRSRRLFPRVVGAGLVLFIFATAGVGGTIDRRLYRKALVNSQVFLMSASDYIRANTAPGEMIGAHDVGALYYFGERPVLDLVGLADPVVAKIYRTGPKRCSNFNARRVRIYQMVKSFHPALVYLSPLWEKNYIGLTTTDRGRHLRPVWHLSQYFQLDKNNDVKVYEYDFYRCDWDHDLLHEPH